MGPMERGFRASSRTSDAGLRAGLAAALLLVASGCGPSGTGDAGRADDAGVDGGLYSLTYGPCGGDFLCRVPSDNCVPLALTDPGGHQPHTCTPPCEVDADCPHVEGAPGVACLPLGGEGERVCVARCERDQHCALSQDCLYWMEIRICA